MPAKYIAKPVQPETTEPETTADRALRLWPRLKNAVRALKSTSSRYLTEDDMGQEMLVFTLTNPDVRYDGACIHFAKNRLIDQLRRSTHYQSFVFPLETIIQTRHDPHDDIEPEDTIRGPEASPEEYLIAQELLAELRARLNPAQRQALDLRLDGYSNSEIADILRISRPRVTQHFNAITQACLHLL